MTRSEQDSFPSIVYSRNSSEHALEDGEQKIWDFGAANRGLCQNILHTKVGQITDELSSSVGEGQRITPEEPLERNHTDGHDGQPYQRESRLATSET